MGKKRNLSLCENCELHKPRFCEPCYAALERELAASRAAIVHLIGLLLNQRAGSG